MSGKGCKHKHVGSERDMGQYMHWKTACGVHTCTLLVESMMEKDESSQQHDVCAILMAAIYLCSHTLANKQKVIALSNSDWANYAELQTSTTPGTRACVDTTWFTHLLYRVCATNKHLEHLVLSVV